MEVRTAQCKKCGYEWVLRVQNPVKCPKCGHRLDAKVYEKREVAQA